MNKSIRANFIRASQICGKQVSAFIEYVQKVDPELEGHEATMVAAAILNQLPSAFANEPEMLSDLKETCETIKRRRG